MGFFFFVITHTHAHIYTQSHSHSHSHSHSLSHTHTHTHTHTHDTPQVSRSMIWWLTGLIVVSVQAWAVATPPPINVRKEETGGGVDWFLCSTIIYHTHTHRKWLLVIGWSVSDGDGGSLVSLYQTLGSVFGVHLRYLEFRSCLVVALAWPGESWLFFIALWSVPFRTKCCAQRPTAIISTTKTTTKTITLQVNVGFHKLVIFRASTWLLVHWLFLAFVSFFILFLFYFELFSKLGCDCFVKRSSCVNDGKNDKKH